MDKFIKIFLPFNLGTILLALIIYNFTELPFIYTVYPIPLTFLVSLILIVPNSQSIIRLFIWLWLIAYLIFPFLSIALEN